MNLPDAIDPKAAKVAKQWKLASPLINCRFEPQGRYLFAACENRSLVRVDLDAADDAPPVVMNGHESWPRPVVFSLDGATLISGGCDDTIIWWETAADEPQPLRTVKAHRGWVRSLDISPDGQFLASGGNDRMVRLWNAADGAPLAELAGHQRDIYAVRFHPSGEFLLSGDLMGQVHQWNLAERKITRTWDAKKLHTYNGGQRVDYGGIRSIDFSHDLTQVIFSGLHEASNPLGAVNKPLVLRYEWESQQELKAHTSDVKGIAWRAVLHHDGFLVAASGGSGGGYLLFWKAEDEKPFHQLKLPNTAREMDVHPDRTRIATAHHDRHLRLIAFA